MLSAIDELSAARPHESRARGYPPAEYRIYREGYYHALSMALKVLDLAYDRWRLARKTRRAMLRQAREHRGRSAMALGLFTHRSTRTPRIIVFTVADYLAHFKAMIDEEQFQELEALAARRLGRAPGAL